MKLIPYVNLLTKLNPKTNDMAFPRFTCSELPVNNVYIELIYNHKWKKKYEKNAHYQIVLHLLNSFRCGSLPYCLCLLFICREEFDYTRGYKNTIVFAFPNVIFIAQTYPLYIPLNFFFHLLVHAGPFCPSMIML